MSDAAKKRIRRNPDDARRLILDAAEASMAVEGPGGLRLMAVAAAAGVSHPTILHHFGSREGLIRALNRRTIEDLKQALISQMQTSGSGDLIGPVFEAYRNGLAQRIVWMLQGGGELEAGGLPVIEEIVAALQAFRQGLAAPGTTVDPYETRALVHLTTLVAFGDAIIGPRLRGAGNHVEEVASRQRFEGWFRDLLIP